MKINAQAFKPYHQKQKSAKGEGEVRLREKRVQRGKTFGEERGREMLTFAAVFFCPPPLFSMRCSSLVNQEVSVNKIVTLGMKKLNITKRKCCCRVAKSTAEAFSF